MTRPKLVPVQDCVAGRLRGETVQEATIEIANVGGRVIVDFGEPMTWIGLEPVQALELADILKRRARAAMQ